MRSILEVIVATKEGEALIPVEELRLALIATSIMLHVVEENMRTLVDAVRNRKPSTKMLAEMATIDAETRFKARKLSPEVYLGPTHIPGTPENLRLRAAARMIFEEELAKKDP